MGISAKIIEDSTSPEGKRLTTIECVLPKVFLAELNTHRAISKNARSTRAVPTSKLIDEVRTNPYIPIKWLKNKPGMQATEPMSEEDAINADKVWRLGANMAASTAETLFAMGLHKQWSGRVIEPFVWANVLLTATDWNNFLALRDHPDAQPEMQALAQAIRQCLMESIPRLLEPGQWHLPYTLPDERESLSVSLLQRLSVSRSARVSYSPFDGNASIEKELERYDLLVGSQPIHASPCEHQSTPDSVAFRKTKGEPIYTSPELHGNLCGWVQYRKLLPGECVHG